MQATKFLFFVLAAFFITFAFASADENEPHFVTRAEWSARRPSQTPSKLTTLPASHVVVSHTVSGACKGRQCYYNVKNIQDLHQMQYGWNDIAYNFLVGGDGNVFEGRGWDVVGAHTKGYNAKSIGIAFIGTFNAKIPTEAQVDAVKQLLEQGVKENKLAQDYKLVGQNQVSATQSPGKKVIEIIKTWDHYTENP